VPPPPGSKPPVSTPLTAPGAPGAPAAGQPPTKSPIIAKAKASPLKFLPFVLIGLAIVAVIGFFIFRMLAGSQTQSVAPDSEIGTTQGTTRNTVPGQQTSLTYWGLWEPSEVLEQVFTDFEQANPGITVSYTKQSPTDYRERLQTAIASGSGPDIFRFHASWTPMLRNELAPVPSTVFSTTEFQSTFYPVAAQQLQVDGQLAGVPLMYDGLELFYNKELLRAANVQPPTTWAELRTLASQLTVRSGETVQRGGLAIGNADNVEHFSDIIGLLMLQNGADLANPTTPEARDALVFYTNFMKTDKVWSATLPSSTVAFARGDVAMMFAPSWRIHEVQAQNPNLDFGVAPLPKLGDTKVTWATYWAEGVNTQSKNKDASWKLLKYLSTADVMTKMHGQQATIRSFGEIYARKDLANDLASNEWVAPFLSDAPEAQGWYLSSYTHDNGINDQLIKYYQDAVNAILAGKTVDATLETLSLGTQQVLRQYGVTTTATP